jgi:hypothetical protein
MQKQYASALGVALVPPKSSDSTLDLTGSSSSPSPPSGDARADTKDDKSAQQASKGKKKSGWGFGG